MLEFGVPMFLQRRPWLVKALMPLANWYVRSAGYRQLGLLADDILDEENDLVQKAIRRLTPKENYDRVYRIRRATQLSVQHKELPKALWTTDKQDVPYLTEIVLQIRAEEAEKKRLDALDIIKRH